MATQGERIAAIETKIIGELSNGLNKRVDTIVIRLDEHIKDENVRFDKIMSRQLILLGGVIAVLIGIVVNLGIQIGA